MIYCHYAIVVPGSPYIVASFSVVYCTTHIRRLPYPEGHLYYRHIETSISPGVLGLPMSLSPAASRLLVEISLLKLLILSRIELGLEEFVVSVFVDSIFGRVIFEPPILFK